MASVKSIAMGMFPLNAEARVNSPNVRVTQPQKIAVPMVHTATIDGAKRRSCVEPLGTIGATGPMVGGIGAVAPLTDGAAAPAYGPESGCVLGPPVGPGPGAAPGYGGAGAGD